MKALTAIVRAVLLAALLPPAAGYSQSSDDNGEIAFIRQAVPKLFGRKPKGALEVQLLLDLDTKLGRAAVVRSLMKNGEFVDHWTDVIVDQLRMQREGDRAQAQACFGAPLRTGATTSALAAFVRDQPPGTTTAPPGGVFNMIDLIRSAIVLDDLSPVYRAYPMPLTLRVNNMAPDTSIGDAFNHTLLNRELSCLGCHNSSFSTTGPSSGWSRTWPAPVQAEAAVYGPSFGSFQQTQDQTYTVFRIDQVYADLYASPAPTIQPGAVAPWGITPECGRILVNVSALPARTGHFANLTGTQIGLGDLAATFKSGSDALKTTGLKTTPVANQLPTVPGDQGFAYLVAEAVTESVWKELLGSRLTIANYFPRNAAQRDTLLELTNAVFNAEHWSLRGLITAIMTGSGQYAGGYFNRKAPDVDPNTPAYRMPMKFDPWVERDPRKPPDPMPDPRDHYNGQGEVVHRNSPRSLLHSVAAALGWPEPQRFPGATYPSMQLEKAMGQFISDDEQGRDGVDFQGLLSWEAQVGVCDKQLAGVGGDDWIDRLVAGVPAFDAANPGSPLTAGDLVAVLKDWLTGDAAIPSNLPKPLDPAHPPLSEADALTAVFGGPLTAQASSVVGLSQKLRRVCGAVLESPQFMLAGIESSTSLAAPRLRVCNSAGACSYQEMCESLIRTDGYLVQCFANSIVLSAIPDLKCPKNVCTQFSSPGISLCERVPGACGFPGYLPSFPIGPGPRDCPICGKPWIDRTQPTGFFVDVPNAEVLKAGGVDYRPFGATEFTPLRMGGTLEAGSMVRLRGGSTLELGSRGGVISTPSEGMPGKNDSLLTPGDRAMFESVQSGRLETLPALIEKGAHVDARDSYGQTPLMVAATRNDVRTLRVLVAHGAELARQDPRGLNAADFAARSRRKEALSYLQRLGLTAKPSRELQRVGPAVEEPWYVFVGRRPLPLHPEPTAASAEYVSSLQRQWAADRLRSRGQAGPVLTERQAIEALDFYMKNLFAKEHPAAIR